MNDSCYRRSSAIFYICSSSCNRSRCGNASKKWSDNICNALGDDAQFVCIIFISLPFVSTSSNGFRLACVRLSIGYERAASVEECPLVKAIQGMRLAAAETNRLGWRYKLFQALASAVIYLDGDGDTLAHAL